MCFDCTAPAFDAYFETSLEEDVKLDFCEKCPFSKEPEDTQPGEAFTLVGYLCWVYICEPEELNQVLKENWTQAQEVLNNKSLVIEREGKTVDIWFLCLADADTAWIIFEEGDEPEELRFPELPYIIYRRLDNIYKIPLELVYNYYPFHFGW
ncbi:hypothetical protein AAVH_13455 [Aphelenchoides avenae]|nr:hypothetical protein AAVH_13455 [Aphelenchus avenae]